MAFVTYGHHALIGGNRKGAIIGTVLTIIFAIIFTGLQYFEYCEAAFTMSDSVYGSAFFASTGLHGLNLAPTKIFINFKGYVFKAKKIHSTSSLFKKPLFNYPQDSVGQEGNQKKK